MAAPSEVTSSLVWVRITLYLVAHLLRDRLTRAFVPPLRASMNALDRAAATTEAAVRAVTVARADVDAADADLDEQIVVFETALLGSVGRNRQVPRYRKVFPDGLTGATRPRSGEQAALARRLEEAIVRDLSREEFATAALPLIRAAREELERREAALRSAEDALEAARAAEKGVRLEASTLHRTTYAELVKLYPHNLRKVRSFFRTDRTARTGDAESETGAAPDATPGSPPPAPAVS